MCKRRPQIVTDQYGPYDQMLQIVLERTRHRQQVYDLSNACNARCREAGSKTMNMILDTVTRASSRC